MRKIKLPGHYDVTKASAQFSSIATVLAGFAFAAVVLVVTTNIKNSGFVVIAFLLPFVGSILASFIFATIAGEEEVYLRSHAMATVAGSGYTITVGYIFFGLVWLLQISNIEVNYVVAAGGIFIIAILVAPSFVILSLLDPIRLRELAESEEPVEANEIKGTFRSYKRWMIILIIIIYTPLVLLIAVALLGEYRLPDDAIEVLFFYLVSFSLLLIVIGGIYSLYLTNQDYEYHITPWPGLIWIFLHSVVNGCLLFLLPPFTIALNWLLASIIFAFIFIILIIIVEIINRKKIKPTLEFWEIRKETVFQVPPEIHSIQDKVTHLEMKNEELKIQISQLQTKYEKENKQLLSTITEIKKELVKLMGLFKGNS